MGDNATLRRVQALRHTGRRGKRRGEKTMPRMQADTTYVSRRQVLDRFVYTIV